MSTEPTLHKRTIEFIARRLKFQLNCAGVISPNISQFKEFYDDDLMERAVFLHSLLLALEAAYEVFERDFHKEPEPFIYNTGDWDADWPIAGYAIDHPEIPASKQLLSMHLCWRLQLAEDGEHSMILKVLRAALFLISAGHSFENAISYIVSLQKNGYVINSNITTHALIILLSARRIVERDESICDYFIKEIRDEDWRFAEFGDFDNTASEKRHDIVDDLDHLSSLIQSEIREAQAAANYDEWIIGASHLHALITSCMHIFEKFERKSDLRYISFFAIAEEIRADAGGLNRYLGFRSRTKFYCKYSSDFSVPGATIAMISHKTEDWRTRVKEDRYLIPAALMDHCTDRGVSSEILPQPWARISEDLAPVACALLFEDVAYGAWRSKRYTDFESRQWPLSWVRDREGGEFDAGEQHDRDIDAMNSLAFSGSLSALADYISEHVKKYPDKRLLEISRSVSDCVEGELTEAMVTLKWLTEVYPYFFGGHWEAAIAYDQNGRKQDALSSIYKAIMLKPNDNHIWQSLRVILSEELDAEEKLIAFGIEEMINGKNTH